MIPWIHQIVPFSKGTFSLKKLIQCGVNWADGPTYLYSSRCWLTSGHFGSLMWPVLFLWGKLASSHDGLRALCEEGSPSC